MTDRCTVEMCDYQPCGRPLYRQYSTSAPESTCLMHLAQGAPKDLFQSEVDALILGESKYQRPGVVDFRGFYFPAGVNISSRVFADYACFIGVHFLGEVDFSSTRFVKDANFAKGVLGKVDFNSATFESAGVFAGVTFRSDAAFDKAAFRGKANFEEAG
jgi:hypothetical protein